MRGSEDWAVCLRITVVGQRWGGLGWPLKERCVGMGVIFPGCACLSVLGVQ